MTPIDEQEAWRIIGRDDNAAISGTNYAATRRTNGWSFAWRVDNGEAPLGSPRFVVADNGRVRRLGLRERADDAIAAELAT